MTDLLAARLTMAISLGFHIVLAAIGMVMPFLMVTAHARWLRSRDPEDYRLTRAWMRGVAIFFATGAVSGTALSFELGLLWPNFMEHAGPIIGMPFSLEGAAFFIEAIAFGLYLYGWGRMPPRVHLAMGVLVGIAGLSSGMLVVAANGWMNSPAGFDWVDGAAQNIEPWRAMLNRAWFSQASHMLIAAFEAVGFAVAGVHAWALLRETAPRVSFHRRALFLALTVGAIAAIVQPINGHGAAQDVAVRQPAKLAAMEAHFETSSRAPLLVGGWPDPDQQEVHFGLEIPGGLSFLAFDDFDAEVTGLDAFPRDEWPPVRVVHVAFQTMVGIGTALAGFGLLFLFARRLRPQWLEHRRFIGLVVLAAPLGFLAMEAGWVVTEVGRQPWIIYGVMRTSEALTPVPGQVFHLVAFASLYAFIGVSAIWMWRRQVAYGPDSPLPTPELEAWSRGRRGG